MAILQKITPAVFFTPLGTLLIGATVLAYFFLANPDNDIIAQVILATVSILLVIFLILLLLWSRKLKSACKFRLLTSAALVSAKSATPLTFKFKPFALPPLCELEICLFFKSRSTADILLVTTGATGQQRTTTVVFTFPHRGNWEVEQVKHRLGDSFGLLRFLWHKTSFTEPMTIAVQPQLIGYQNLPALASTYREGNDLPFPRKRAGDYYDFRRYNPADGSRRILWKVYARTQQLLSRQPEESMAPAGLSILYSLALTNDDSLAAAFVKYLSDLEQADVDILASCLGAQTEVVSTSKQAHDLLIHSAFNAGYRIDLAKSLQDFQGFLEKAQATIKGLSIDSLIFFVSDTYLRDPASLQLINAITAKLSAQAIQPIFCLLTAQQHSKPNNIDPRIEKQRGFKFANVFFEESSEDLKFGSTTTDFLQLCSSRGWRNYQGLFRS